MKPFDAAKLGDKRQRPSNVTEMRSACYSAYLGDHTLACRVLGCFTAFVDSRDRSQGMSLLMQGHWEISATELIAQIVRPGMHVVDVGACWGYFSLLMAQLIGPNGRLDAVEPNPRTAELLRETLVINGFKKRVRVHTMALGEVDDDDVEFVVRPSRFMNNHLLRLGELEARPDTSQHLTTVSVRRLDTVFADQEIDFMKVDVEGAEHALVKGMPLLLARCPRMTMLMEFNASRLSEPANLLTELATRFHLSALKSIGLDTFSRDEVLASDRDFHIYCEPNV